MNFPNWELFCCSPSIVGAVFGPRGDLILLIGETGALVPNLQIGGKGGFKILTYLF